MDCSVPLLEATLHEFEMCKACRNKLCQVGFTFLGETSASI